MKPFQKIIQGQRSTTDERVTAALKAVEIDDQYGGLPVQIRVVEGKEPKHFLKMFQGKLRVFMGGVSAEFEGNNLNPILTGPTKVPNGAQVNSLYFQVDQE